LGLVVLLAPAAVLAAEPPQSKDQPGVKDRDANFKQFNFKDGKFTDQLHFGREIPVFAVLERMDHLLVPGAQAKLNLSEQQLDQLKKLECEFRAHRRDMLIKLADNMFDKCRTKDANGEQNFDFCQAGFMAFTGLVRLRGVRDSFETKAYELLTAEQKKQYAQLEGEWLHRFAEHRAERREHRDHFAHMHGEWRVFDTAHQEHMKLTAEQRQKLMELRKEMNEKLKTILTDEQFKALHSEHHGQFRQIYQQDEKLDKSPRSFGVEKANPLPAGPDSPRQDKQIPEPPK
jgi:hypothetical protein